MHCRYHKIMWKYTLKVNSVRCGFVCDGRAAKSGQPNANPVQRIDPSRKDNLQRFCVGNF